MMLENAVELLMDADSIIDDYLPKDESNNISEAICIAIDTLRRQDKYRWHDIIKNPDDLPDEGVDVFVCVSGGSINRSWLEGKRFRATTSKNSWRHYSRVKAWRYIEPYEVE